MSVNFEYFLPLRDIIALKPNSDRPASATRSAETLFERLPDENGMICYKISFKPIIDA